MPRVPISSVSPQIQGPVQVSAPAVSTQRDATGQQTQQVGAALQQAGQATFAVGERLKFHYDLAKAKKADNLAEEVIRSGLTEYTSKLGQDATGVGRKETFDGVKKRLEELGRSLDSPEQRRLFDSSVQARMSDAAYKADVHEAKQVFAFEMAESKVRAEGFIASAGNADPDTDEFDTYRGNALAEIDTIADRLGLPVDSAQRKALLHGATTTMHTTVVGKLLEANDVNRAKSHLDASRDEITPGAWSELQDDVKRVEKKLTIESIAQTAVAGAQQLSVTDPDNYESLDQQQAAASKAADEAARAAGLDSDAQRAVLSQLDKAFDQRREQEARAKVALWNEVETDLLNPANRGMSYEDILPEVQRQLEVFGLKDRALALARGDARSEPVALRDAARLDDDELRGMKEVDLLANFQPQLSRYAMQDLHSRWKVANGTAPPDVAVSRFDTELLETYAAKPEFGAIVSLTSKGVIKDERTWRPLEVRVRQAWTAAGAKTYEQKRQVLDDMLVDQAIVTSTWPDSRRAYETLTPEEREDTYFQTTEGLVHAREIKDHVWPLLREKLIEENQINQALGSTVHRPLTHESMAQLWVSLGRPQSKEALEDKTAAVPAGTRFNTMPDDVRQELTRQLTQQNIKETAGRGIIPFFPSPDATQVDTEWRRWGRPTSVEQLRAATPTEWWNR